MEIVARPAPGTDNDVGGLEGTREFGGDGGTVQAFLVGELL